MSGNSAKPSFAPCSRSRPGWLASTPSRIATLPLPPIALATASAPSLPPLTLSVAISVSTLPPSEHLSTQITGMLAALAASTAGTISLLPAGARISTSTFWVTRSSTIATCLSMSVSLGMPRKVSCTPCFFASASAASFIVTQYGLSSDPTTKPIRIWSRGFFAPPAAAGAEVAAAAGALVGVAAAGALVGAAGGAEEHAAASTASSERRLSSPCLSFTLEAPFFDLYSRCSPEQGAQPGMRCRCTAASSSLSRSPRRGTGRSCPAPVRLSLAQEIDADRGDDHHADEYLLPEGVDVQQVQAVAEHCHDEGADERPPDAALASEQAGATDHHRGDGVQLA